ncbi:RNA-dependent RNA polymerase, mitoviral [Cucumis melo var. makuwa]|uniref:RNA-dependent RNA polymerase, mitoviral n=1 Tax=Cucumis melo var. makuwa TaxID=1194695 RepID=A0A5D3CHB7_CUCMM|nr:RNA-dependent RNA polymerase, mitoviral [Cucumis melo var. makuwa]
MDMHRRSWKGAKAEMTPLLRQELLVLQQGFSLLIPIVVSNPPHFFVLLSLAARSILALPMHDFHLSTLRGDLSYQTLGLTLSKNGIPLHGKMKIKFKFSLTLYLDPNLDMKSRAHYFSLAFLILAIPSQLDLSSPSTTCLQLSKMEERRLNQIRGVQNGSTNRLRLKPYKENSKGAGWAKRFHLEPYIGMELIGKGKTGKSKAVPLKWWIGRGMPLNAYLRGQIVLMLVREHKLKELRLVPSDFFTRKGEKWVVEYTTYWSWLSSYKFPKCIVGQEEFLNSKEDLQCVPPHSYTAIHIFKEEDVHLACKPRNSRIHKLSKELKRRLEVEAAKSVERTSKETSWVTKG